MNEKSISEKIIKKYNKKNIRRYTQMLVALFFLAILYNFFIQPAYLTTGGINAIAVLLKYLYHDFLYLLFYYILKAYY